MCSSGKTSASVCFLTLGLKCDSSSSLWAETQPGPLATALNSAQGDIRVALWSRSGGSASSGQNKNTFLHIVMIYLWWCLLEVCSDRKQAWALHSRSQKWRRARAAAMPSFTSATNRQQRRHDCDEQSSDPLMGIGALWTHCCEEILTQEVFTHHFLFGCTSGQRAVAFRLSCGGTAALRAPLFLLSCV